MKKLRLLALMDETLVPPDDVRGIDVSDVEWKTEFDVVSTLRELGHEVQCLGVRSDLAAIRTAITELQPHVVFNLLEDFHDVPIYDQNVVSYLELLGVPYTGCNPRGLMLARDKGISKKLLSYHRIPVPEFAVFRMGTAVRRPRRLAFPLIVKSLTKEGSAGISQTSLVTDDEKLAERVAFIHERLRTDAIVERFIDGRELYVGILGNARLQVFPVWELLFTKAPEELPRIATEKVKWDAAYRDRTASRPPSPKGCPTRRSRRSAPSASASTACSSCRATRASTCASTRTGASTFSRPTPTPSWRTARTSPNRPKRPASPTTA